MWPQLSTARVVRLSRAVSSSPRAGAPQASPCWTSLLAAATRSSCPRRPVVLAPSVQSLVGSDNFTHILRVLNTNVDGKQKIMYALTAIKGLGRRFSNICCKKAEVDLNKR